jgi:hypothetical protein
VRNHFVANIEKLSGNKVPSDKVNDFKSLMNEYKVKIEKNILT